MIIDDTRELVFLRDHLPCGFYRIGGSTNFDVPPLESFSLPSLPPGFEDVFDGIDFEDNTFGRSFRLRFSDDYLRDDSGIRKVKAIARWPHFYQNEIPCVP